MTSRRRNSGPTRDASVRRIALGALSLFGHYSGDRLAIRMRDRDSDIRRGFTGLRWYPVDESFRVPGRYVPHDEPRTMRLPNILGDVEAFRTSGSVALTVDGEELRMTAVDSGDRLWFIFRDLTSGSETYAAARFPCTRTPRMRTAGRRSTSTAPTTRRARSTRTRPARCRRARTGCRCGSRPGSSTTTTDGRHGPGADPGAPRMFPVVTGRTRSSRASRG